MNIAQQLVATLRSRKETLSFCESLTAGLATSTVASVPGASAVLRGSLVTYATDLKAHLAGVDAALLQREGAVSPLTAEAMAIGARHKCGSDWAVALTGVAGPKEQDGHPVGEIFVAVAGPQGFIRVLRAVDDGPLRYCLSEHSETPVQVMVGDRQDLRERAVNAALKELLSCL